MKYTPLFLLLVVSNAAFAVSSVKKEFSNTLAVSDKPGAQVVTITVSDLRFMNSMRKDLNVQDALNKISVDEEATLNDYWRAIATGESIDKRAELSYAAERVFRDSKMKDFLVTHMRWLNDELKQYLLAKGSNSCKVCSAQCYQLAQLENKKLSDAEQK